MAETAILLYNEAKQPTVRTINRLYQCQLLKN